MEELDEREVKGRWKSFVGKWNRGELAEGWYDTSMLQKAQQQQQQEQSASSPKLSTLPPKLHRRDVSKDAASPPSESSDSEIGPAPPSQPYNRRAGPAIPSIEDLEYRDDLRNQDRTTFTADIRYARKQERQSQKAALEELVPRADAGTRERQLEKKREITSALNAFREAKSPGAEEIGEGQLMGEDGAEVFKKRRREEERKKNEREIRKEEIMRARMAEREERVQEHRVKEEKTMEMLRAIARERFG